MAERTRMMRALLVSLVFVVAACTGDDEVIADAPGSIDAPETPTVDGPPATADAPVTPDGPPADAPAGAACGGIAGLTCADTDYCDYPDNGCGGDDGMGTCTLPGSCTGPQSQVCACDGNVYADPCAAQEAGFDVSYLGGCTAPTGTFACGYLFCESETEYCEAILSDVPTLPHTYACRPVPGSCPSPPTCTCLAGQPCSDWCTEGAPGDLTLECPGG